MPDTPTPEPANPLAERVKDHRHALTSLMGGTGRCDDITSGLGIVDIIIDLV